MATEAELLAGVVGAPFDDAPRLAYADHLDAESDGPSLRAEFIRLQIRLATERFDEPSAATAGDVNAEIARKMDLLAAQRRQEELLAGHQATWAEEILKIASDVHFERGFVSSVVVGAPAFVKDGASLLQLAPIVYVELRETLTALDQLIACPALAGVRALSLSEEGIGDDELSRFLLCPHLHNLWWLELGGNNIGMVGLDRLATVRLSGLRYVGLAGNPVDPHETAGADGYIIQDVALPPEGEALEAKHGFVPWLHYASESLLEFPPNPRGAAPP